MNRESLEYLRKELISMSNGIDAMLFEIQSLMDETTLTNVLLNIEPQMYAEA